MSDQDHTDYKDLTYKFGKYNGTKIVDVDDFDYFKWYVQKSDQDWYGLNHLLTHHFNQRKDDNGLFVHVDDFATRERVLPTVKVGTELIINTPTNPDYQGRVCGATVNVGDESFTMYVEFRECVVGGGRYTTNLPTDEKGKRKRIKGKDCLCRVVSTYGGKGLALKLIKIQ